ncbi:MAG: nucleotide-binding protein [Proteobacteria bacterium]|nr:nucleotide-binding protein [Pseudomonadota bacterium]
MPPKVFIGSSTKGLPIAEAIQKALSHTAEAVIWNQGVFRTTNVPIENLLRAVGEYDFGVFVFLPEDELRAREEAVLSVRDNVIFEVGLFIGTLGRERTFFLAPKNQDVKAYLPSDLAGITPAFYDPAASSREAAVGAPLYEVREAIRALGARSGRHHILYDGRGSRLRQFHFDAQIRSVSGGKETVTLLSNGELRATPDGTLCIDRRSRDARYEVTLCPAGPGKPSLGRRPDRVLLLTLEARTDGEPHDLSFVLKRADGNRERVMTLHNQVTSTAWTPLQLYLRGPQDVDLLLRIDDKKPGPAPSSVFLRNLLLVDVDEREVGPMQS